MNIDKQTYKKYAKSRAPSSPLVKDMLLAFLTGGAICAFAEGIYNLYLYLKIEEERYLNINLMMKKNVKKLMELKNKMQRLETLENVLMLEI
jgi:hypothetical protein